MNKMPIISAYVARAKNRLAGFLGRQRKAKMERKLHLIRSEIAGHFGQFLLILK
jgi:hypothetical protein